MSAQHTEGRWYLSPETEGEWEIRIGAENGPWILRLSSIDGTIAERKEDEANCLRIVQCVNAHDELVAALRPFANYACNVPCDCHNCRARAAIAKATGSPT
jgi:hypothetical protein